MFCRLYLGNVSHGQVAAAPAASSAGAGAGKARRRRWQAEKDGVVREFATASEAQAYVQELVAEIRAVPKRGRPKKLVLPDIELYYGDEKVTDLVIENKPVIEWLAGPDIEALELAMLADEAEDDELINAHMKDLEEVRAYLKSVRRMFGL